MNNKYTTPTIFTLLGATGDLARKKLFPALFELFQKEKLPQKFLIIAFARREYSKTDFQDYVSEIIRQKQAGREVSIDFETKVQKFLDKIVYFQGDFNELESYERLAELLKKEADRFKVCPSRLYHLAVPPIYYENILKNLAASGLSKPCADDIGWSRILVEKPFGHDLNSARELDRLLSQLFKPDQIFCIDHYLAKESMQNILDFRFANKIFEPSWNNKQIKKVTITLLEKDGVGTRGNFYDGVGALRDVGQNHLLQMLALIAMEKPERLTATAIREKRGEVLRALKPLIQNADFKKKVTRAQYLGYTAEKNVTPESQTETYFTMEAEVNNDRWQSVPFFLQAGKGFAQNLSFIEVDFGTNVITFELQPQERISLKFLVKTPGLDNSLEEQTIHFKHQEKAFKKKSEAYEKVLFDSIVGDQTLFPSPEEIEYSWRFITPIINHWTDLPLHKYKLGVDTEKIEFES